MGFDERFIRMWEYYLALSEAGFATGITQDLQIVLEKRRGLAVSRRPDRLRRAPRPLAVPLHASSTYDGAGRSQDPSGPFQATGSQASG